MKLNGLKFASAALVLVMTAAAQNADTGGIDIQRSVITIHTGKAGLLSAAGHEHWINAPISSGALRESPDPHVEFVVETAKMTVKPAAGVDSKTEASIQKDLEEMTLEVKKFPEIAFRSSCVEKLPDGQWKVEGSLSLHGVTRPVSLLAKWNGDSYTSHAVLKQTDYGIKPISIGGVIKVKNEVEIDFQIFPRKA